MKISTLAVLVLLISVPYIQAQGEEEIVEEDVDPIYPDGEEEIITDEDVDVIFPEPGDEIPEEEKKPETESHEPCVGIECGYFKQCVVNDEGEGECKCLQDCRHKIGIGPRYQVCSNQNETFPNICNLEREKCMCDNTEEGCVDPKHKNVELKYQGRCRGPLECPEELLGEFSIRIRTWLRPLLMNMADMYQLSRSEIMMAREAVQPDRGHIVPVLWKFCDLDKDPSDGQISPRELLPLVAQLYPMEDCAETFFKSCDGDNNSEISLQEFGSCMGLADEEIENRCKELVVDDMEEDGPEPAYYRREHK